MEIINNPTNEQLINIVRENPNLPIVPMVDSDIIGDGDGWWLGNFSHVVVGEYACYGDRYFDDRDDFKEYYYNHNSDELCEKFNYSPNISLEFHVSGNSNCISKQFEENKSNEQRMENYLNGLAEGLFTKAIILYIGELK